MAIDWDDDSHDFPWETIDSDIERWLKEDAGRGDVTTDLLPLGGVSVTAEVLAKSDGVLAGVEGFLRILRRSDPGLRVEKVTPDGTRYRTGDVLVRISGDARSILRAERTAMNLLNHLSGVATLTAEFVKRVAGTKAKIVDTRKNIPGLRALQKYAVRCGGGSNHRPDLAASVLLKDNHIVLVGAELEEAIELLRRRLGHTGKIEVEVDDIDQVERAASAGADIIMLDNMTPDDGREAVQLVGDQVIIEASGGVTLQNVREWAESGVDVISVGALTHSAPSANLSLEFVGIFPSDSDAGS
jgi:nicotinate-nucleotide pyrophosphorylase (carboxylating)